MEADNKIRRRYADKYYWALVGKQGIDIPIEKKYAHSAWHNYVIRTEHRDELNAYLASKGISTGVHYEPIHFYKVFGKNKPYLPVTEKVWTTLLTLPLYPDMMEFDFKRIVIEIIEFLNNQ